MAKPHPHTFRARRHRRIRARVSGTGERPRLAVFRSAKHLSAQLIDDGTGRTLVAASDRDLKKQRRGGATPSYSKLAVAAALGETIARRAQEAGIVRVVFDRGGFAYHGRIKALADAARKSGLKF
ncbi:MAG: 50S ribosomal protein L18 [Candidatus Terrybacteria bacterium]|nr:50S ribosomal protein L18 [Candidatus Terrybacteria bacterium]